MYIFLGIVIVFLAGIFDSTFVLPGRYIKKFNIETMWFIFGLSSFIIMPFIFFYILDGNAFYSLLLYKYIPVKYVIVNILGCIAWGLGMICFVYAFKFIGVGIGFAIDIGVSTALMTVLSLFLIYPEKIYTYSSLLILLSIILFVTGLFYYGISAYHRDLSTNCEVKANKQDNHISIQSGKSLFGILLSVIGGIGSALQGVAYMYCLNGVVDFFPIKKSYFWMSCAPLFIAFLATGVIYCGYFLIAFIFAKKKQNNETNDNKCLNGLYVFYDFILSITMGIILFIAAILFCLGISIMPEKYGAAISFPIFIMSISVGSSIWSFLLKEWKTCSKKIVNQMLFGTLLFIIAIVVIAYSSCLDIFK